MVGSGSGSSGRGDCSGASTATTAAATTTAAGATAGAAARAATRAAAAGDNTAATAAGAAAAAAAGSRRGGRLTRVVAPGGRGRRRRRLGLARAKVGGDLVEVRAALAAVECDRVAHGGLLDGVQERELLVERLVRRHLPDHEAVEALLPDPVGLVRERALVLERDVRLLAVGRPEELALLVEVPRLLGEAAEQLEVREEARLERVRALPSGALGRVAERGLVGRELLRAAVRREGGAPSHQ